jgi:hypothetical protein
LDGTVVNPTTSRLDRSPNAITAFVSILPWPHVHNTFVCLLHFY